MRLFLSTFIFLISISASLARCGGGSLSVLFLSDEIPRNPIFVMEGSSFGAGIIDSLNEKYPVYLQSGDERVELIVLETRRGMYRISQAILKPIHELEPNREYEMIVENLPSDQKLHTRSKTPNNPPPVWRVIDHLDVTPPVFEKTPKLTGKEYKPRGCGPEANVFAEFEVLGDLPILVETELKELRRNTTNSYFLLFEGDVLKVGRNMCQGAFTYEYRKKYQVRFRLVDFSGNSNGQWSEWLDLDPPLK